jgi:glycosyltransferase involved in cell wall biosynthesis
MRILFISTTFPDASAPARGTYNAALCRELHRQHSIRAIAPRPFSEALRAAWSRKPFQIPADMAQAGLSVDYPTYWYTPRILDHRYGDQMWWSVRRAVETALTQFRPHAVLSYWAHPDGDVGLRAAQLAGVPCAVIVGGSDVLLLPKDPRRGIRVREVLRQSSAVITVSEGLRNSVCDLGVAADRVHTLYQGIDPGVFHTRTTREQSRRRLGLSSDEAHLLWVGRMVPVKALPLLLETAMLLRDRQLKFKLHLIGEGPERSPLQEQSARLGLDGQLIFHGAVGHDAIPDWYRAADLTLLCSDSEGLPNVLRESLACGTPFVSTDVGSIREIAAPGACALVPPRQPALLTDAIQSMLVPETRQAAALYEPQTWAETARQTAQLLQSLQPRNPAANPRASLRLSDIVTSAF